MNKIQRFTFPVPINAEMLKIAEQLKQQQNTQKKQQEVYLNTLAVLAVNFYCQCMEIETELGKSLSLDSIVPTFMNVADLKIKKKGRLECRPVLPGEKVCYIPSEVWSERIGYIVVEIDEKLKKAKLLGFVDKIEREEVSLHELRSLTDFLELLIYLEDLKPNSVEAPVPTLVKSTTTKLEENLVQLNQWFANLFDGGWQLEELTFAGAITREISSSYLTEKPEVNGAKIIRFMLMPQAMVLTLRQKKISHDKIEILLKLYPATESIYLPDGVKMTVLDREGKPIPNLNKEAKSKTWLQLKFKGNLGDRFSLKVSLGEDSITENFLI